MKNKDIDSIIRSVVTKYLDVIVLCFLLLSSLVIRIHLMKHGSSSDYLGYIIPWVEQYKNSIRSAFREGVGDYYIPYNVLLAIASKINVPTYYSVGTISCIFDYLTAFFIYKLLSENFIERFSKKMSAAISAMYLFAPTVLLNGAAWKQCDSIYSFFVVVLLKCILDDKIRTAFVMLGIAFSFKQQAIFVVPLLIILYFFNKNIKIAYSLYTILVYLIAGLPAIILGRPAGEVYSIYLAQADKYHQMTLNYPNWYMIGMTDYEKCHIFAKLFTVFIFAMAFWYICSILKSISAKTIMILATWSIWTCCMFLPSMHQRYDYLVAILMVVCVPLIIKEKLWYTVISAILFYVGNIITYSYSLFGEDYNYSFAFCCNAIAYILFCYILWYRTTKEECYGTESNHG